MALGHGDFFVLLWRAQVLGRHHWDLRLFSDPVGDCLVGRGHVLEPHQWFWTEGQGATKTHGPSLTCVCGIVVPAQCPCPSSLSLCERMLWVVLEPQWASGERVSGNVLR